ncbi:MAG TPA: hypothetical protein VJZ72_09660 [Candidatus Limnocylindrales bacterium]|nr:hypothetical protein [Candidatus Limnocylindrales bacterium]
MSRLVALYPAGWRSRYGAEMEALLAARPPTIRDRVDIARGALDARLHPQLPGPARVTDRRGFAPFAGFALLGLAVLIAANGPVMYDDYGTYRDGVLALPFLVLSMILLSIGLYATVVRLPADDRLSSMAGVIAIVAGPVWATMPWVLAIGLAFLAGVLILAVGARRAGVWPASALVVLVAAVSVPAGLFVAQLFLPWYALRLSGLNLLVVIGPLAVIWLVVGLASLRGREELAIT